MLVKLFNVCLGNHNPKLTQYQLTNVPLIIFTLQWVSLLLLLHVFVSSTPGHHRPSGREIGHISPTVGNKSHCCRNISLPRPETRGVCNSITLQPAVMHATSPAPRLSPLHTQDTQDAFNRRRLHTHCSLQTPALLPMYDTGSEAHNNSTHGTLLV